MALDTRDKRSSAIMVSLPWRGLFPLPDGTVNQGDRQQCACMYRGIAAQTPSVAVITRIKVLGWFNTTGR